MAPNIRKQHGQILPITLAGLLLGASILFMLGNIGNSVTDRSATVDAADAAAYSGATWVSQHLNTLAYVNRAMIANHVGIGHFVAYVSWIRYVEDFTEKAEFIARFFRTTGIGTVIFVIAKVLAELADFLEDFAEEFGAFLVPGVDGLNLFYALVQDEIHFALGDFTGIDFIDSFFNTPMDNLMQATAETFDADLSVNDTGTITSLDTSMASALLVALREQNSRIANFITDREATDEQSRLLRMVEHTFGERDDPRGDMSREWLTDRQANIPLISSFTIEKQFDTDHELGDDLAEWEAEDKLVLKTLFGFGPDITLASGEATAEEFDDNYEGISEWYGLSEGEPSHAVLPVVAYVSKPLASSKSSDAFDFDDNGRSLSALSIAHVEHRRPVQGFEGLLQSAITTLQQDDVDANAEFANLFNPFWRARIVGTHYADLGQVDDQVPLRDELF